MHHEAPHDLNMIVFAPVEALAMLLLVVPVVVAPSAGSSDSPSAPCRSASR